MAIGINNNYSEDIFWFFGFIFEMICDDLLNMNEPVNDVFTYLDVGGEQEIFAIHSSYNTYISQIMLDLSGMQENGTVKLYSKIDQENYVEIEHFDFTVATDSKGLLIDLKIPINVDFKITYTEESNEGADIDIPYNYILEY